MMASSVFRHELPEASSCGQVAADVVGQAAKIHELGDPGISEWTTLRMGLAGWIERQGGIGSLGQ
jgi:hypothetical protein